MSHMQYLGYTYTKILYSTVYLKFKCNWMSYIYLTDLILIDRTN